MTLMMIMTVEKVFFSTVILFHLHCEACRRWLSSQEGYGGPRMDATRRPLDSKGKGHEASFREIWDLVEMRLWAGKEGVRHIVGDDLDGLRDRFERNTQGVLLHTCLKMLM